MSIFALNSAQMAFDEGPGAAAGHLALVRPTDPSGETFALSYNGTRPYKLYEINI